MNTPKRADIPIEDHIAPTEAWLQIYPGYLWYDFMELKIPNTTNAIDGHFADLKNKLRNHNGLSISRKKRFVDRFLQGAGCCLPKRCSYRMAKKITEQLRCKGIRQQLELGEISRPRLHNCTILYRLAYTGWKGCLLIYRNTFGTTLDFTLVFGYHRFNGWYVIHLPAFEILSSNTGEIFAGIPKWLTAWVIISSSVALK